MTFDSHPFTLRQLQYAVAVAESLSFRKAAERCHVAQPSLSAQLAQMETALGVRLFERDTRRVLITPTGHEILARARVILRETADLVTFARRFGDPLSGTLRIGIIPTVSPYLLPRLAPALREAYPRLGVWWIEDKTQVLVRSLEAGTLDAALLALEADIGAVEHEIIAKDAFVLAAPWGHPLAATTTSVQATELRGATVLVLQDDHCFGAQAVSFCADRSAEVDAFRATSLTTLVQMVAGGTGVTLLPALALPHEVTGAELSLRAFADPVPYRTLGLVWRKQYPFDTTLRHMAATIRHAYPAPQSGRTGRVHETRRRSRTRRPDAGR